MDKVDKRIELQLKKLSVEEQREAKRLLEAKEIEELRKVLHRV
jgi:hypothetical protein